MLHTETVRLSTHWANLKSGKKAYLGSQLHLDVHPLFLLLQDAQQVLLKHAYSGEKMIVMPAALHVIKVHPESQQKLHTAGIQSDLLGPGEQGGPVPLVQHGQFQHLPGADSNQRGRQSHGSRTHDEHGDLGPPLSEAVQAHFYHDIQGHCHQSAQSSVIGECAILFLCVFRDATNSSILWL